mmetsp:Transcript_237/g.714  ORF Transcript_237/g.714 Transcript_237/m.714 type:complete len:202 (+) Transcript_237:88-693(+)
MLEPYESPRRAGAAGPVVRRTRAPPRTGGALAGRSEAERGGRCRCCCCCRCWLPARGGRCRQMLPLLVRPASARDVRATLRKAGQRVRLAGPLCRGCRERGLRRRHELEARPPHLSRVGEADVDLLAEYRGAAGVGCRCGGRGTRKGDESETARPAVGSVAHQLAANHLAEADEVAAEVVLRGGLGQPAHEDAANGPRGVG